MIVEITLFYTTSYTTDHNMTLMATCSYPTGDIKKRDEYTVVIPRGPLSSPYNYTNSSTFVEHNTHKS